jgi:thioredoxin reductase (NADPH)
VTWVVPLALGGVAILLMAVFTMLSARKRHRAIVEPAVSAGPRILVHDINDDRCTGCDACVAVCPTNVLDLVANKSRVLRFHDCIQCEACMFACPTEALVMFPEGGTPPVLKVPEIDENFQTAVPGQYLIGEVAGKPLVKNAANLGRAVIEHMLATGLRPGALGRGDNHVDVAIVGSGPGGLSTALTCIQKGLSYVVLEKEQMIASTITRYPKGKLVMAEPYDTVNLSLLPVFDAGKEQLIPIWSELIERVGMTIKQGESVESVARGGDGVFDVRTTVAAYRAQRMVLSIGTRGKPRTLQVQGENLPKVYSLLEDPDEWRGRAVLVVGGGDSACEAALALADAGAKVMISYRGKGFNRAAPKNKNAIEGYASEGRIKAKLGSQILVFEQDSVTLQLSDGAQKRYPNDAAFVLIGADPPVAWLEKMGVRFVERPHQYQLGKTDDIVRKFVARAVDCPEDAARAAAQVLGGSIGVEPSRVATPVSLPMPMGEPVSGPRKWLRSATSIFSSRGMTNSGVMPMPEPPPPVAAPVVAAPVVAGPKPDARGQRAKKFDAPVPLSEFAKRGKSGGQSHTGHGRRDALSAGERTRILRMLRDEGGRLADEDEQVYIGSAPANRDRDRDYDFDFDDSPGPAPTQLRPDVPAKPAVVVGIAQAQAARTNNKRAGEKSSAHPRPAPHTQPPPLQSQQPPLQLPPQQLAPPQLPPQQLAPPQLPPPQFLPPPPTQPPRSRSMNVAQPVPRRPVPVPAPFGDEPTRQVDDDLLTVLRSQTPAKAAPKPAPKPTPKPTPRSKLPRPNVPIPAQPDEPTRMAHIDSFGLDDAHGQDDRTRPTSDFPPKFLTPAPATDPSFGAFEDHHDGDEATRLASLDGMAALERARNHGPPNDERTRAVNIRNDPSISDIDWDLD